MVLMLSATIRHALLAYRKGLEARFGPARVQRVCLYGSWARGEATEDSDIDVAAVIDGLTAQEWTVAIGVAAEVEDEAGLCFSPFVLSTERFDALKRCEGIAQRIEREGLVP